MDKSLGRDAMLGRLRGALSSFGTSDADLYVHSTFRGFARYSNNALNQHSETEEQRVAARVGVRTDGGYRLATVCTSDLAHDAIVAALERAADVARRAPVLEAWPGFARPQGAVQDPPRYSTATAECGASIRADLVASALAYARANGLTAAGALETRAYETGVVNTAGVAQYASGTLASFKMFALDPDGVSGFAQATHRDVTRLDVAGCAAEACEKSRAGKDPVALPAGEYDVVLEAPAVVEWMEWLSFTALGAREVANGTSPLAGNVGKAITGSRVTLVDDACDPSELGFGVPFDRDGVPRRRVVLIDKGIAQEPVYDRLYGARLGKESTGHAAPSEGLGDAPVAQALSLAGGEDTLETLTQRVERGLFVSRFHYVNGYLEPRRALMTGLTRDGTFLIERGERTRGVYNMRFTDSVLEAFARIDGLTSLRAAVSTWWTEAGAFAAPALLIRRLRFTGGGVRAPEG